MSLQIVGPFNSGPAVGGAGAATSNTDTPIPLAGRVVAVCVRYNDSPPAGTTDIAIVTKGTNAPPVTILTIANAATDGWFYPRPQIYTTAGALIASQYDERGVPIADYVNNKIDGADAGDNIDVWYLLEN